MGVLFYYSMNINGCTSVLCVSLWRKTRYNLHTAPELCNSVWITVPFPVSSRWLSSGHLVGRREQPRDASSLPNFSSWHAPYHHKLPHSGENGTHTVRLPVSSRGPGLVKPLWPGETWQEAAGPAHDRSNHAHHRHCEHHQAQQDEHHGRGQKKALQGSILLPFHFGIHPHTQHAETHQLEGEREREGSWDESLDNPQYEVVVLTGSDLSG